jgi:tetratricopeptide (TPR) repeat protein
MQTLERPVNASIAEIEALCARRAFAQAVEMCETLLAGPQQPHDEARVRVLAGQALGRSSRPRPALEHLRRARKILAARPEPMLLAECADWEAACLYLLEDSRALAVGEEALALCRALDEPAPLLEARILEHIGSIHVRNHRFDSAIQCYEQALTAAGAIRELPRLARIYHGLAVAYDGRGETDRAIEYVHKALSLYSIEDDAAMTARAENELGLLLMRERQFERAEVLFLSALRHLGNGGTEIGRSHVMLSLGEMYLATGRLLEAVAVIRDAIERAHRQEEPLAESAGHQLLGKALERLGRPVEADEAFRGGLAILSREDLSDRLVEMHASYASVLERRSNIDGALHHLKEAVAIVRRTPTRGGAFGWLPDGLATFDRP